MSLFDGQQSGNAHTGQRIAPLAERMRPHTLAEYSGQEHLLAPGKPLRLQIDHDDPSSMIFWGPPGVGKTTLAKIIAETTQATFIEFSAVLSGIKEIKQVMAEAADAARMGSRTILFIDEIHRFNKAQQDAFLPYVERGTIRLIGATTENPSFEIIGALLSRCRVYVLEPLSAERISDLLHRALTDKTRGLGNLQLTADEDALMLIAAYSSGDCRSAYNVLEIAAQLATNTTSKTITKAIATEALQQRVLLYDKSGEEHYNLISALHKSVRNSDPDAALYWLARMFAGGEDPLYLARRITRMAIEDIGLAAPEALNLCNSARQAVEFLGSPEGDLALAEAVVYLSLAPKSNSVYLAWGAVKDEIESTRQEPVPLHLRNAPTKLMKQLDYGKGYKYAHSEEGEKISAMDCLPEALLGHTYYHPTNEGREKQLAQRMDEIRRIRESKKNS
jgi:putative ATPase